MKKAIALIIWFSCAKVSFASEIDEQFDKGVRLLNGRRFQEAAVTFQKKRSPTVTVIMPKHGFMQVNPGLGPAVVRTV